MAMHVRHGDFFKTPGMLAFTTTDLNLTTSTAAATTVLTATYAGRHPSDSLS